MSEKQHFNTLDEMIAWGREQGATHISFGNYHDGALWKAERPNDDKSPFWLIRFNGWSEDGLKCTVNGGWAVWGSWAMSVNGLMRTDSHWNGWYPFASLDDNTDNDFNKYKYNARLCHDTDKQYNTDNFLRLFN